MGEIDLSMSLLNSDAIAKKIRDHEKAAGKALKRTVSDFKSRAPAWIGAAVTEEYGIKKADVKAAISSKSKAGSLNIGGITVDNIQIKYEGRVLTPTHFKMQPAARPKKKYKVTAVIKKGSRQQLSPIAFLAHSGGAGTVQIPFQRTGSSRLPVKVIKTLSVPQMITNEKVAEKINKNIVDGLQKRFEHHLEREISKI